MAEQRIPIEDRYPIVKWDKPGTTYRGHLLGVREGKHGLLYDLQSADGEGVTLPSTAKLQRLMALVRAGADVEVTYLGPVPSGKANPLKDFAVNVFSKGDKLSPARRPAAAPATIADDGVPF